MKTAVALWAADPHQYGPGKVHVVDAEKADRTYCGKMLAACPGKPTTAREATCQICRNAVAKLPERERQREQWARDRERWEQRQQEIAREREEENRQFWEQYNAYLRSPVWQKKRTLVIQRAGGICEACRSAPAVQAHHLTYNHVFCEPLFDLVAVCIRCHDEITTLDRERRARR